jgi:hypothetical protein
VRAEPGARLSLPCVYVVKLTDSPPLSGIWRIGLSFFIYFSSLGSTSL